MPSPTGPHLARFNQERRDAWVAAVAGRLAPGSRVLDAGAGPCRYRGLFAHCDYRTQDFCQYKGSPASIYKDTWAYGHIDYVCDITAIPAPDASFDAILCTEVLEHLPRPLDAIVEFARLLKPGGRLFLTAPLGAGLHQEPWHFYGGFTPRFYTRFLDEAGFDVVSILPNGGLFRRLLEDIHRAADTIQARRPYRFWNPLYWALRIAKSAATARWLSALDDRIPVEAFTVGYFVEAVRRRPGAPGQEARP